MAGVSVKSNRNFLTRLSASALCLLTTTSMAQMPLVLQEPITPTAADWERAKPVLEAALECRARLPHSDAVRAVLGTTNDRLAGRFTLPAMLEPFGLPTQLIWISAGPGSKEHYTALLPATALSVVVRAARLRKIPGAGRYGRATLGGYLTAESFTPETVVLTCRWSS